VGRLQDEIKQRRPFGSLEEEAYLSLQRTADALARRAAEVLKPSGLSATQYNVLRILRGAGDEGLACREIGNRMITHDPDITRLLDRLEGRGFIVRARSEKDRRVITTRITAEGRDTLRRLDPLVTRMPQDLMGRLDKKSLRALTGLLDRLREPAAPDCDDED
jgi:MarR family transcriptional regulator, organic hydroperoxide resistance regulator